MITSPKIYTITTLQTIKLELIDEEQSIFLPTFGDRRCVGYYTSLSQAKLVVRNNVKNIHEGMYQYVVIEEVPEGVYKYSKNRYVFEWKDDHYEEIKEPLELSNTCGFGIG